MPKNIIIYYPTFAGGGITRNLENIIKFLKKKNFLIHLFSHQTKNLKKDKKLNIVKTQHGFLGNNSFMNIISSSINLFFFLKKNKNITTILSMKNHLPAIIIAKIFKKKNNNKKF